jgi:hypothetical protein
MVWLRLKEVEVFLGMIILRSDAQRLPHRTFLCASASQCGLPWDAVSVPGTCGSGVALTRVKDMVAFGACPFESRPVLLCKDGVAL